MATRDLHNNVNPVPLFVPVAARTTNTAIVSAIIDTKGFEACELVITTGTNTSADAVYAVLVEDGDDAALADAAAVDDKFLLGTEAQAGFTFADDNACRKIGYAGSKRYVRVTVTPSGTAGNTFLSGVALLSSPRYAPTANPPA